MTYKGRYPIKNPSKYNGDPTNIVYRSGWELTVMKWLDLNDSVIRWSSEEIRIPYIDPFTGKRRNYYPDFVVELKDKDGNKQTYIWEVKPHKQTQPPEKRTRVTRKYLTEVHTYGINKNKFEAADKYCKQRGWEFVVMTEKKFGFK